LFCWQVREALLTSALLKLPASMTKAEKLHRVDTLLQLLVSAAAVTSTCLVAT
jgi:hypothetical protein